MSNVFPLSRDARRSRRKHPVRSKSESMKRMPQRHLEVVRAEADWAWPAGVERPRTREECIDGPRPCPFVGCRHNLFLDVSRKTNSIQFNFPDRLPEDMPADRSCVLDVVESIGAVTLEGVGELMNVTRERVRQMEEKALRRIGADRKLVQFAEGDVSALRGPRGATGSSLRNDAPEVDDEGVEETHYRDDEAERFGRTAATLVLAGWRPLDAWDRANELLDEDDPLPALFADVETPRTAAPPMATPPERRIEPPADVERFIPREVAMSEDLEPLELDEDEEPKPPEHRPEHRPEKPRAVGAVAGSRPAAGPAGVSPLTKERPMGHTEEVLELLKIPKTTAELKSLLSWAGGSRLSFCLTNMKSRGLISQAERGGPWVRNPVPEEKPKPFPFRKRSRTKRAKPKDRVVHRDLKPAKSKPKSDFGADLTSKLQARKARCLRELEAINVLLDGESS